MKKISQTKKLNHQNNDKQLEENIFRENGVARNEIQIEQLPLKNHHEQKPNDNNSKQINGLTQNPFEHASSLNSIPILSGLDNKNYLIDNNKQQIPDQMLPPILDTQQQQLKNFQQQQQYFPNHPEQQIDLDIEQQATYNIHNQQEQSNQMKNLQNTIQKPSQLTTQQKSFKKNKKTTTYQQSQSTHALSTTDTLIYTNQLYFHMNPCCCGLLYQDDCCCKWICDLIFHLVCLPIKIIVSILSSCCCWKSSTKQTTIEVFYTPFRCCGDWINQCWFSGGNFCCKRLDNLQDQLYRNFCIRCWLNTCLQIGHFLQNCCLFTSKCLPNQNGFCCCQTSWDYVGGICLKCGSPEEAAQQIENLGACVGGCCCCCC